MRKLILLSVSVAIMLIGCLWLPDIPGGYINLSNPTDEPVTVYSENLNDGNAFLIDPFSSRSVKVEVSSGNSITLRLYGPYYGGKEAILRNNISSVELTPFYSRFQIDNDSGMAFDNLYIADIYGNKSYMFISKDGKCYTRNSNNKEYEVSSYDAVLRIDKSGYIFVESSILRNPCKLFGIIGNRVLETDRYSLFQIGNTVTMSTAFMH